MTKAKSLLLGSAAALVAVSGAQAADLGLPVAPAVDYVQICSVGSFTGFLLPGSDVCFDISGFAQWQTDFNAEGGSSSGSTVTTEDDFDMTAELELNFDARTMTEWGLLRGFVRLGGDGGEEDFNVDAPKVFVQLGGLTAGVTDSFFDPVFTDYAVAPFGDTPGTEDLALIGYAFNVGNGLTFMASLEDNESRNTGIASVTSSTGNATYRVQVATDLGADGALGGTAGDADTVANFDVAAGSLADAQALALADAGTVTLTGVDSVLTAGTITQGVGLAGDDDGYDESATMPDFVAALRVDQAWGSAKLSGALRELDPFDPSVDSEIGFAVGASAEFNLPVGYGSVFGIFGHYGQGAVEYTGFDNTVANSDLPWVDAIVDGDDLELTDSWGVGAGVDIGLTEMISWQLEGFYGYVDHFDPTLTVGTDTDNSGTVDADEFVSTKYDLDGSVFAIRSSVKWEPVSGLLLAAGVAYQQFDFDNVINSAGAIVDADDDDDQFGARLRIRRSF